MAALPPTIPSSPIYRGPLPHVHAVEWIPVTVYDQLGLPEYEAIEGFVLRKT